MIGQELITCFANSPIAQSAINTISGALIGTIFLRNNTATKEFEKLKAGEFKVVLHDLVQNGEMTYKELYEAKNYLAIAEKADKYYQKKNNEEQNRNFDWFYRFYDYAGKISDEEIQELWAKILAGEINEPGSFSFKTLNVMCNLSLSDICLLEKFYKNIIMTNDLAIPSYIEYLEKSDIAYADALYLDELGLISCTYEAGKSINFIEDRAVIFSNENLVLLGIYKSGTSISVRLFPFTRSGTEISSLYSIRIYDETIYKLAIELKNTYLM